MVILFARGPRRKWSDLRCRRPAALASGCAREASCVRILTTLPPANYTTIVRGKDNTTGIALNEAYKLQQLDQRQNKTRQLLRSWLRSRLDYVTRRFNASSAGRQGRVAHRWKVA
jgi:hypothetical protein